MTCGSTTGVISFLVRGLPIAQGSTRTFVVNGKPVITTTAKGLAAWRRLVADQAQPHAPPQPWDTGVTVHMTFYLPKPKNEPKNRRTYPIRRPDLDKCIRAVLDALTYVFWTDDARVLEINAGKRWAGEPLGELWPDPHPPGVYIQAWPIENQRLDGPKVEIAVPDEVKK